MDEEGKTITNKKEKANILNNFFLQCIYRGKYQRYAWVRRHTRENWAWWHCLYKGYSNKKIETDPSKSPGPDGMHSRVLKELAEELANFWQWFSQSL